MQMKKTTFLNTYVCSPAVFCLSLKLQRIICRPQDGIKCYHFHQTINKKTALCTASRRGTPSAVGRALEAADDEEHASQDGQSFWV